jgi:LIVCS family branched-chain amino acid:cation transporter
MNQQTIRFKDTITIGLMLFALFFGAGNLVFPPMLGQNAGDQIWLANLGFLMTGVGLPLLATLAFGFSGSKDLLSLTSRVHPWFAVCYTTLLYLSIGPLFALPRTGSVSFEIGLKPYFPAEYQHVGLAVFTVLFFGVTLIFSLNPAKMVDIVGKMLTPALIAFIALLAAASFAAPMGDPVQPAGDYGSRAFSNGFQEGYLTMDALAAFVFGIIVIEAIRAKGGEGRKSMLLVCFQAALIAAAILAAIYSSLAYIGATSVSSLGHLENGGQVLNQVSSHYFGTFGGLVLGIIVLLACLTTSIGLTTSCSSYFHKLLPGISYRNFCIILCVVSGLAANVGLNALIQFSAPVLTILYPLAIVLVILTFLHHVFGGKRSVYVISLLPTFLISLVDGLSGTALELEGLHRLFSETIPFFESGLGWLLPAFAGALIGSLLPQISKQTPRV